MPADPPKKKIGFHKLIDQKWALALIRPTWQPTQNYQQSKTRYVDRNTFQQKSLVSVFSTMLSCISNMHQLKYSHRQHSES